MISTLIIDDQEINRLHLKQMLLEHFPHIKIVGEADGVENGITAITKFKPDVVLLDIEMKDGDAFDLLERINSISFKIIFITAYEEYALKAIKFSALDYLLKPVSVDDLKSAFLKAESQLLTDLKVQLSNLQSNLQTTKNTTLALRTSEKIFLIKINDIIRCEAGGSYTYFFITTQKKHIVSQPMKEFEELLTESGFIRVHKSHLINISYIESFAKKDGGFVILKDKTEIPVSRRKKNELLEVFSKL